MHVGKDSLDVRGGSHGVVVGYTSNETEDRMSLAHSLATRVGKMLTVMRKSGLLWWLRPDGRVQVKIQYLQKVGGSVKPQRILTVVSVTQHAESLKDTRCGEVAGFTGPDATASSMEEMSKLIVEEVMKKTLEEIMLKSGRPAPQQADDSTEESA